MKGDQVAAVTPAHPATSPATGGGGVTSAASDGGGAGLPIFHTAHTAHAPHTARWLQPFGFGDGWGGFCDGNFPSEITLD